VYLTPKDRAERPFDLAFVCHTGKACALWSLYHRELYELSWLHQSHSSVTSRETDPRVSPTSHSNKSSTAIAISNSFENILLPKTPERSILTPISESYVVVQDLKHVRSQRRWDPSPYSAGNPGSRRHKLCHKKRRCFSTFHH
jgi:hypothetical protein